MYTYILATIFAGAMIIIAAIAANLINFEGGTNPKDKLKRRVWFWILAVVNPIIFFFTSVIAFTPNPESDPLGYDTFMGILPIAIAFGFLIYIVIGFILSKIFRTGKIGHWF